MEFIKALIPAAVLTWIVATIIGSNGSKGGFLFIHYIHVTGGGAFSGGGVSFYWTWPLFIASLGLAFAIFKMLD
jgi:hypothetical protein